MTYGLRPITIRDAHVRLLQDYHCVEGSSGAIGVEAAPAPDNVAEASPDVVTLPLSPLNLLATMHNSLEEEGNKNTRTTLPRLTF